MNHQRGTFWHGLVLVAFLGACDKFAEIANGTSGKGTGGTSSKTSGAGGSSAKAGSGAGGTTSSATGGSSGSVGSGGLTNKGGTTSTDGSAGTSGSGGSSGTGGGNDTGGAEATGGNAAGGSTGSGGAPSAGGSTGAAGSCSLPTTLVFGNNGGLEDGSRITPDTSGSLTVMSSGGSSCLSRLPACGTGCAITVATLARDLADPDVQAAFAAGSGAIFGVSLKSLDVADFLVTLGDGRSIEMGASCCRFPGLPCQPIPKGVQRLVSDLQSLMAAITVCTPIQRG